MCQITNQENVPTYILYSSLVIVSSLFTCKSLSLSLFTADTFIEDPESLVINARIKERFTGKCYCNLS